MNGILVVDIGEEDDDDDNDGIVVDDGCIDTKGERLGVKVGETVGICVVKVIGVVDGAAPIDNGCVVVVVA